MLPAAGSLQALLENLIDYAGLFPPASLSLVTVCERFAAFLDSPERWMLNRLVLPASKLREAVLPPGTRVTLLVDEDPGPLPSNVETLETKLSDGLSLPTYCEAPLDEITRAFAKFRTGGVTPEAIPSTAALADFLCHAASRRMAFKATAGLHHPVRSMRALTYAEGSPRAMMHGFLNVFTAAVFAWHGLDRESVLEILEECDPVMFVFRNDELEFRGRRLTVEQIHSARRDFAHSFGSCSFEEPVAELRDLGLLQ